MTYPDVDFGSWVNETFVAVKLNLKDAGAEAQKYGVIWAPWLLLVDENGEQVSWTVGPLSPSDYRAWLERVQLDHTGFPDTAKVLAVDPNNPDINLMMGKHYLEAGTWDKAIEHLKIAVQGTGEAKPEACMEACVALGKAGARAGNDSVLQAAIDCLGKCAKGGEAAVALERVHAKLFAGQFEEAAKGYDAFLKEHGGEACAAEGWYWYGVAQYQATKKPDGLMAAWQKLIDTAPDSEWAKRASMTISK